MRAVMVEADETYLAERRRRGQDVFDEMWEGVLHMNPPPSSRHQRLALDLAVVLRERAMAAGLEAWMDTGLYRPGRNDDYRVPDLMVAARDVRTDRGVEGPAALVIEIRSPGDESYAKLPFYASLRVPEVLVIAPDDLTTELFRFADGQPVVVEPVPERGVLLTAIATWVRAVEGSGLHLSWNGGEATV